MRARSRSGLADQSGVGLRNPIGNSLLASMVQVPIIECPNPVPAVKPSE
jgi:hypothetical protein